MTVKELIEKLQTQNPDSQVVLWSVNEARFYDEMYVFSDNSKEVNISFGDPF